jgi:hypothetical protein
MMSDAIGVDATSPRFTFITRSVARHDIGQMLLNRFKIPAISKILMETLFFMESGEAKLVFQEMF